MELIIQSSNSKKREEKNGINIKKEKKSIHSRKKID